MPILRLGLSLPKPLPSPLIAQTAESKRKLKTHPQLQLIALYKPNLERERGREKGGVTNMFAERVVRIQLIQLSLISHLLHSARF